MRHKTDMPSPKDISDRQAKIATTRWLESQRGRPQYRPAPPLSKAVSKVMRPLSKKHGGGLAALEPHWETIMGPRFAKISRPVKMTGSSHGRQLVIGAPGPAGTLIMAAKNQIIDRLNGFLGPDHIKSIKVIQSKLVIDPKPHENSPVTGLSPSTADELQSGLEHVRDPDVKAALNRLGHHVMVQAAQKRSKSRRQ